MKKYTYHDVHFRGTIERVRYKTTNPQGEPREKYANVYLPYGYDQEDKGKKYNILYLMHGGGGNPDAWLDCCKVKNMLDYCFDAREAKPMIVVFPSFYKEQIPRVGAPNADYENQKVRDFLPEEITQLLPAVEGRYNVYARDTTDQGLRAARAHRGFGGFSMGSCTTWYNFLYNLPYFSDFLPLSGDCWAVCPMGGQHAPEETARLLKEAAEGAGLPFRIFSATGTEDKALGALTPLMEQMKRYPQVFSFSEDPAQGNLHYQVAPGETHCYEAVNDYLYTYLPYLFA